MISVRLYKRRKRRCQVTTLWCSAVVLTTLAIASAWYAGRGNHGRATVAPAMDLGEPDMPQTAAVSLPVNGDGMGDTPHVVFRLVPALIGEAAGAVHRGDAGEAFREFNTWIASGKALHSGAFWIFWAVLGAGMLGLGCWSVVNQCLNARFALRLPKASGTDEPVPTDGPL